VVGFHCFNFTKWQKTGDKKLFRIPFLSGILGEGNSDYTEASEHKPSNPRYLSVVFSVYFQEASILSNGPR